MDGFVVEVIVPGVHGAARGCCVAGRMTIDGGAAVASAGDVRAVLFERGLLGSVAGAAVWRMCYIDEEGDTISLGPHAGELAEYLGLLRTGVVSSPLRVILAAAGREVAATTPSPVEAPHVHVRGRGDRNIPHARAVPHHPPQTPTTEGSVRSSHTGLPHETPGHAMDGTAREVVVDKQQHHVPPSGQVVGEASAMAAGGTTLEAAAPVDARLDDSITLGDLRNSFFDEFSQGGRRRGPHNGSTTTSTTSARGPTGAMAGGQEAEGAGAAAAPAPAPEASIDSLSSNTAATALAAAAAIPADAAPLKPFKPLEAIARVGRDDTATAGAGAEAEAEDTDTPYVHVSNEASNFVINDDGTTASDADESRARQMAVVVDDFDTSGTPRTHGCGGAGAGVRLPSVRSSTCAASSSGNSVSRTTSASCASSVGDGTATHLLLTEQDEVLLRLGAAADDGVDDYTTDMESDDEGMHHPAVHVPPSAQRTTPHTPAATNVEGGDSSLDADGDVGAEAVVTADGRSDGSNNDTRSTITVNPETAALDSSTPTEPETAAPTHVAPPPAAVPNAATTAIAPATAMPEAVDAGTAPTDNDVVSSASRYLPSETADSDMARGTSVEGDRSGDEDAVTEAMAGSPRGSSKEGAETHAAGVPVDATTAPLGGADVQAQMHDAATDSGSTPVMDTPDGESVRSSGHRVEASGWLHGCGAVGVALADLQTTEPQQQQQQGRSATAARVPKIPRPTPQPLPASAYTTASVRTRASEGGDTGSDSVSLTLTDDQRDIWTATPPASMVGRLTRGEVSASLMGGSGQGSGSACTNTLRPHLTPSSSGMLGQTTPPPQLPQIHTHQRGMPRLAPASSQVSPAPTPPMCSATRGHNPWDSAWSVSTVDSFFHVPFHASCLGELPVAMDASPPPQAGPVAQEAAEAELREWGVPIDSNTRGLLRLYNHDAARVREALLATPRGTIDDGGVGARAATERT